MDSSRSQAETLVNKGWVRPVVELVERLNKWAFRVSALVFILAMFLTVYEVFSRYFFNHPTRFNVEIGGYILLMATLLAVGQTFLADRHPAVDVFSIKFPAGWKKVLNIFSGLLAFLCGGVILWQSITMAISAYNDNWRSFILSVPIWLPVTLVPLGSALLCLAALARIYRLATARRDTGTEATRRVD